MLENSAYTIELSNKAWKDVMVAANAAEARRKNLERRDLSRVSACNNFKTLNEAKEFMSKVIGLGKNDKEKPDGFKIISEKNGTYTLLYNYYLPRIIKDKSKKDNTKDLCLKKA